MQPEHRITEEFEHLRRRALTGNANTNTYYQMGLAYQYGRGTERNRRLAARWFEKCIGLTKQNVLPYLEDYFENTDLSSETAQNTAREALQEEFDSDQINAHIKLFDIEDNTISLLDISKLVVAAHDGDVEAQYQLGLYFLGADNTYFLPVYGGENEGLHWMLQAAEQGYSKAYSPIAEGYGYIAGVAIDINAAFHWAEKAYVADPTSAWQNFANHYLIGGAVEKDVQKYIDILLESGDLEIAPYLLGQLFISGRYIEVDAERAAHYFAQCQSQNLRELGDEDIKRYYDAL
ncbi:MAG: hypothetical protein ABJK39_09190 [Hyphomicrobiales bacterium]